jgi:hypothetical protein
LTYQLIAAPSGVSIDANGIISWTPTLVQSASTNVITTVVTDYNPWAVNNQRMSATNSFTIIVSGTAPFMITSISASSGIARVTWNSVAGQIYRLQYRDTLNTTNWQDVLPDVVATDSTTTASNTLGSATQRFYRVMLVPAASAPIIQSITVAGGVATVTWTSTPSRVYRLQYLDNLVSTNWQEMVLDLTATAPTTVATNNVSGVSSRFYRVRLVP